MNFSVKTLISRLVPLHVLDIILAILAFPSALVLRTIRKQGIARLPASKRVLLSVGVFPIREHYYEPLFNMSSLRALSAPRNLPGVDWNLAEQLSLLSHFDYSHELAGIPMTGTGVEDGFHFNNYWFESGDAEYWYNIIRHLKPARIIEIGSGYSTLVARKAIDMNRKQVAHYRCDHTCVEPFERDWLERTGAKIIRSKVEDVGVELFRQLQAGDILFIDSSHMIRPQGDVLFEFLELLPQLSVGVIVHIHDIFTPHDYPADLLCKEVVFWNEQYLLEAFLSSNSQWKIIGALSLLHHAHFATLHAKCPYLTPTREPASFYIQKIA